MSTRSDVTRNLVAIRDDFPTQMDWAGFVDEVIDLAVEAGLAGMDLEDWEAAGLGDRRLAEVAAGHRWTPRRRLDAGWQHVHLDDIAIRMGDTATYADAEAMLDVLAEHGLVEQDTYDDGPGEGWLSPGLDDRLWAECVSEALAAVGAE